MIKSNIIKKPFLIDIPVLITFFVRFETFELVFRRIKEIKPSILFLASDGPRKDSFKDAEMISKCRKIADEIDWDCKVYRLYSESNIGLLKNTFKALEFAFELVDRLIFLEDDILPSKSFFNFCDILLEKYKNDERVHMICGMNHLGSYDYPDADYFFSQQGSIWGFALWKRTFSHFDRKLNISSNNYSKMLLKQNWNKTNISRIEYKIKSESNLITKNNEDCIDFELLAGISMVLNSSTLIIPKKNLIKCLGISENSAHSVNNPKKLPKQIRNIFNMETYEINFPLKHPSNLARDLQYECHVLKILGKNKIIKFIRRAEGVIRRLIYK